MCYTRFLQEIKCFSRLHQATVYPQNLAWLPKSISYNHIVSHRIEAQKARVLARAWLQSSSSSWAHLFWRVPSLMHAMHSMKNIQKKCEENNEWYVKTPTINKIVKIRKYVFCLFKLNIRYYIKVIVAKVCGLM